jgi:hypothetical protein
MATIDESGLAAKIRDRPINDRLRRVLLAAAANAGVDVVYVVSGGQPGSTGQRTGSNRHDDGNAADLELIAGGRTLDFTAQSDLATFCRFVAAAAASGATGIGVGVDYMGPTRLYVGFGNGPRDMAKVVWGAGGAAANAPAWLSEAAAYGWANPAGAGAATPGDAWPDQPAGGEVVGGPGESAGAGSEGPLQGLPGELVRYSERSDGIFGLFWRAMVALFQLCIRLPVTGVADPQTTAALMRYGPFFRFAGPLVAAVGVVGLGRASAARRRTSISMRCATFARPSRRRRTRALRRLSTRLSRSWKRRSRGLRTPRAPLPSTQSCRRPAWSSPAAPDRS